jgi:ribosomal protein S18 acetylase RimI-like enzyme
MLIENCTQNDIEMIQKLYSAARSLQIERKMVVWPSFDNSFIINEINEKRQWKIVENGQILCNWAITFEDKEIWEERDKDDAIYIHRICNNPAFRGNRFIEQIVEWAKPYAAQLGKKYVRLDTLGNNTGLIKHYTSAGFEFLGIFKLTDTTKLPKHYQDEPNCCLFEMSV